MSIDTAHRFATLAEEREPAEAAANAAYGFWIYIMSDCVLFAALFATFVVLGRSYAGGPTGQEIIDLPYTFGETMLLLCSSMTCGLAILGMQGRRDQEVVFWLIATFLLGLGFIGMEANEFHHMVATGADPERSGYLSAFFTLVATHGAHVTIGLLWMAIMMIQIVTKGLTMQVRSRLLRLGMFWHFLDIVWVGVFTIVYLQGAI